MSSNISHCLFLLDENFSKYKIIKAKILLYGWNSLQNYQKICLMKLDNLETFLFGNSLYGICLLILGYYLINALNIRGYFETHLPRSIMYDVEYVSNWLLRKLS